MSNSDKINASLIEDLLTFFDLMAALKSGAIGGNNQPTDTTQHGIESGQDVPLQHTSDTSNNNNPLSAKKRKEDGNESYDEAIDSWRPYVFKTKLNATARKKEIMKLGLPDCK